MSRTVCTKYHTRAIKNPAAGMSGWEDTVTTLVLALQEQYESSQGDSDKAGSVEDASFYDGQVDILTWVLGMLTVEPPEEKRERLEVERDHVSRLADNIAGTPEAEALKRRINEITQELNTLGPTEEKA